MVQNLKIAVVQLAVGAPTKEQAIQQAVDQIRIAKQQNDADLVILPECWNSTFNSAKYAWNAELIPQGSTAVALSALTAELEMFLICGSYPEKDSDGNLYNTSVVFGPGGQLLGRYRKMHLLDMDIPRVYSFKESNVVKAGNEFFTFHVRGTKIGVGIGHDQRFPEFAAAYRKLGVDLLIFPSAFEPFTGALHYELNARARALDNSMFVVLCSLARDPDNHFVAYGHSVVCDPMGRVMCRAGEGPEILQATLEVQMLDDVKRQIPVLQQKRHDLYGQGGSGICTYL